MDVRKACLREVEAGSASGARPAAPLTMSGPKPLSPIKLVLPSALCQARLFSARISSLMTRPFSCTSVRLPLAARLSAAGKDVAQVAP